MRFPDTTSGRSGSWRTLKGNKAHGRNERFVTGDGGERQRTRRWSKALEPAALQSQPPPGWTATKIPSEEGAARIGAHRHAERFGATEGGIGDDVGVRLGESEHHLHSARARTAPFGRLVNALRGIGTEPSGARQRERAATARRQRPQ
jgi:hypothetical protein